ncbi:MAG: OprD family outer membrane porin [Gammaproteobacteria bacterium]
MRSAAARKARGLTTRGVNFVLALAACSLLCGLPQSTIAAEYQSAEQTAPTSVEEIDTTLGGIARKWVRDRRVVFRPIDEWRKTRGPFLRDGQFKFDFRTFNFDATRAAGEDPQAWAAGGELAIRTGKWRDFLSVGASWYGSYEISGNDAAGGSGLIQPNGDNISVIGQAFVELTKDGWLARFFRQELDLPYINRFDIRMVPNTFEAYGVGRRGKNFDFLFGQVEKIKRYDSDEFVPMSVAAGVAGSDKGVTMGGFEWSPADTNFDIGAASQYTHDLFNTFYTELNWDRKFGEDLGLKLSGQYTDQRSVGEDLLGDFETHAWGARIATSYRYAVVTLAFTQTDDGAGIRSPYGGRPSYLSLMIRNFDRANERAWRAGLSYHFDRLGLPNVSAIINVAKGRRARDPSTRARLADQTEYDCTVDFRPERGILNGLWLRLRYARVDETGAGKVTDQIRIIANYSLPIL